MAKAMHSHFFTLQIVSYHRLLVVTQSRMVSKWLRKEAYVIATGDRSLKLDCVTTEDSLQSLFLYDGVYSRSGAS